jgi:hypothetical protein
MHQFDSQSPVEGARVIEANGGGHGKSGAAAQQLAKTAEMGVCDFVER